MHDKLELLKEKTIIALDLDTLDDAKKLARELSPYIDKFKIGSALFSSYGPDAIEAIAEIGGKIFLDLKYHDIPSVIAAACRTIAENHPSVFLLSVHASGGPAMVALAVDAVAERDDLDVIAVTALTSLSSSEMGVLGVACALPDWAEKLGNLALESGASGLICSAREMKYFREAFGDEPIFVTPGIRPKQSFHMPDDQTRTCTPAEALKRGADYIIMGRPIYRAENPVAALRSIAESL